jgi:hypothetical protein
MVSAMPRDVPTAAEVFPDAVIEVFKKDIDRTLLRENLRLTVEERVVKLQRLADFAGELRRAGRAKRKLQ